MSVSGVVSLMVWCLSFRKQRAASCPSARPGCASGKGVRRDPKRNEIDRPTGQFRLSFWVEAPWSALRGWPLSPAKQGQAASAASCALARGIVTRRAETLLAARGGRLRPSRARPEGARPTNSPAMTRSANSTRCVGKTPDNQYRISRRPIGDMTGRQHIMKERVVLCCLHICHFEDRQRHLPPEHPSITDRVVPAGGDDRRDRRSGRYARCCRNRPPASPIGRHFVEVTEILISQNERFELVAHILVRKTMPWIAIKVPELPIDARRENTEYRGQTLKMRRNDPLQRWPTLDGPRNGRNRPERAGGRVRTPVTGSRAGSQSRGAFIAILVSFSRDLGARTEPGPASGHEFSRSRFVDNHAVRSRNRRSSRKAGREGIRPG